MTSRYCEALARRIRRPRRRRHPRRAPRARLIRESLDTWPRPVNREHKVAPWYSQAITLSYQRVHGLRAVNQAFDGGFQVSVSRVVPASMDEIIEALGSRRRRAAWLKQADPELAAALNGAFTGPKPQKVTKKDSLNAVLRFRWGRSRVEMYITGKPRGGASVIAWNTKLDGNAEVESRRMQWRVALDALKQHLSR